MVKSLGVIVLCYSSGPNHLAELYGLQKLSLLREFCLKTGVQVILEV